LHELSNWGTTNDPELYVPLHEQELYVPLLFVELLKRRGGNHDEQSLETLEETIRAKFRQAKEERERKAREKEESVMTQASCSRSSAAKALRANHGNIVKAIMELTM
jgi:NACalpha-BTF3-like transcription factor